MAKNEPVQRLPHEYFPPIGFSAAGKDNPTQQANLIQVRQAPMFTHVMATCAEALLKRADLILMDFTQAACAVKYSIDGFWYDMPPRDRPTGDGMLACFKKLGDLNVADRRSKQEARYGVEFLGVKYHLIFSSQGVPTGERALVKFVPKKPKFANLDDLGIRDKLRDQFKELINQPEGIIVISAPPNGGGLTTTWRYCLEAADRFVRDFISVESVLNDDEEIINITPNKFDPAKGESPDQLLPKLALKQPDVFVVPDLVNAETVRILCQQITTEHKMAITRVRAKEASEALLRTLAFPEVNSDLIDRITCVVNSRMIRKLCDCKQPFQPAPALLQRLGIPPGRVQMLYRQWQPPPPPPPDAKVKPEPPQICQKCQGLGYYGRTAMFELLEVNDQVRQVLKTDPRLDAVRQVARQTGMKTIQEEGILLLVKGVTSLEELQRVLKQ